MQVLPDLTKFMDSIHNKMMTVHKMIGQLEIEAGEMVAAKEFLISCCNVSHPTFSHMDCLGNSHTNFSIPLRLMEHLTQINDRLSASFKMLAALKADLTLQEDTSEVSELFLGCIACMAQKPHLPRNAALFFGSIPSGPPKTVYELNRPSLYFQVGFANIVSHLNEAIHFNSTH